METCIKSEPEACASTSTQPDPLLNQSGDVSLCRLCANIPDRPVEIYGAEGESSELSEKINKYLPIQVTPEDQTSLCCCWTCVSTLLAFHELAVSCLEAEKRLQIVLMSKPKMIPPAEPTSADELMDRNTEEMDDEDGDLGNEEDDSEEEDEEVESKPVVAGTSDDTESDISITDEELRIKSEENGDSSKRQTRSNGKKTKVLYECDMCDSTANDAKRFVIHYLTHNKDKSRIYGCDRCLQRFTQPGNLKRHIDVVHLRIRRFCCKICETTFTTKTTRDDHMTAHYDGRSNVCSTCDMSFESKRALRAHRQTHLGRTEHSDERKTCATCNESFKLKQSLKRHIERKHLQLKFYCEVCKKLFTNKYNRDKHMKIHMNFCDICGKKFNTKADLRMHKKFHVVAK